MKGEIRDKRILDKDVCLCCLVLSGVNSPWLSTQTRASLDTFDAGHHKILYDTMSQI